MSAPVFVPLACLACGRDLEGEILDRVVFCARCGLGFAPGARSLVPVQCQHVPPAAARADAEPAVLLPFWCADALVVPAFLSARPLTLARVATAAAPAWKRAPGCGPRPPSGARLGPEALPAVAQLCGWPVPADPPLVLGVPAWRAAMRWRVAGLTLELLPEDVQVSARAPGSDPG